MLLSPSGMTAAEAEAAFAQLKSAVSRQQAEHLLGKPNSEEIIKGITTLSWQYYTHDINQIDVFYCSIAWDERDLSSASRSIKAKIEGKEAWRWR